MTDKLAASLALAVLLLAVLPVTGGVYAEVDGKKDPRDAENPDFDISSFGMAGKTPYIQVYGHAGGTLATGEGQIFAYVIYTDTGIWAVNSHGFGHGDPEGDVGGVWHSEFVVFGGRDNKCLVEAGNESEHRMDGTRVFVVGSGATEITKAQTVELVHVADNPKAAGCPKGSIAKLVEVFDTAPDED